MTALLSGALAYWRVALLVLLCGLCFWAGDRNRNNIWAAKQALQVDQQAQAFAAEVQRGQVAARQAINAQMTLQSRYESLEGKFDVAKKHSALVVLRGGAACAAAGGGAAGGLAVGAGRTAPASAPLGAVAPVAPVADPAAVADDGGAGGIRLTAAAVWVWNSALGGTDTPAGACGAADPTSPACAADTGLGLDAAWANHTANAKSCALDRQRHQQLIDYLSDQKTP